VEYNVDVDWTDSENDLIVADYFSMLTLELEKRTYNKAEHNRNLRLILTQRSEGSIEFKHQNISAVMVGLGKPWITGYKPLARFQASLVDAVLRWLEHRPDWLQTPRSSIDDNVTKSGGFSDQRTLWIGPPPTFSNQPNPINQEFMAAISRKYDVAERDARNRALGKAGELEILNHEKLSLKLAGRDDLAEKVQWTAIEVGDGAGYDISSFEPDGREKLIEVKTTNGWERTPFHITRNELSIADANRDTWHLIRLWNFAREPKAYSIRPPLESHVALTPTSFLATIN
jgi:hypothetical protein